MSAYPTHCSSIQLSTVGVCVSFSSSENLLCILQNHFKNQTLMHTTRKGHDKGTLSIETFQQRCRTIEAGLGDRLPHCIFETMGLQFAAITQEFGSACSRVLKKHSCLYVISKWVWYSLKATPSTFALLPFLS